MTIHWPMTQVVDDNAQVPSGHTLPDIIMNIGTLKRKKRKIYIKNSQRSNYL
ncbi:MAG TPA: hypothetical protein VFI70_02170 [Nitrososphaeraceae archaeon]|nr:hypothetical protein [Nitrososphaeraceae archaeon]